MLTVRKVKPEADSKELEALPYMYLLKRLLSPYTEADLVIGIFSNWQNAQAAKTECIARYSKADRWAKQGYKDVNLEEDVIVQDISTLMEGSPVAENDSVYVVSLYEEGFGQITRKIERVFTTEAEAGRYLDQREEGEKEWEPCWYAMESLQVDVPNFNQ